MGETAEYLKGKKRVDEIFEEAKKYRNEHGYKENLGYDQQPALNDYLYSLNLTYAQQSEIIDYFYVKMNQI